MLEKVPPPLGHALRDARAGMDKLVFNRCGMRLGHGALKVASLAFADHAPIPSRYTADGEGVSPPLHWNGVPPEAASVLLIVEDADAPTPEPLVHAIVVDLPPADGTLHEGELHSPHHEGAGAHEGRNSFLRSGWLPPDPPTGHGTHRYAFQLFALAAGDPFPDKPGRSDVLRAVQERGLASGLLIGTYEREGSEKIRTGAAVPA